LQLNVDTEKNAAIGNNTRTAFVTIVWLEHNGTINI